MKDYSAFDYPPPDISRTMRAYDYQDLPVREHACLNDRLSKEPSWWEHDAQGIPLCRVCDRCRDDKLSRYRPEILSGYDQSDVNEDIEPDRGYGEEPW